MSLFYRNLKSCFWPDPPPSLLALVTNFPVFFFDVFHYTDLEIYWLIDWFRSSHNNPSLECWWYKKFLYIFVDDLLSIVCVRWCTGPASRNRLRQAKWKSLTRKGKWLEETRSSILQCIDKLGWSLITSVAFWNREGLNSHSPHVPFPVPPTFYLLQSMLQRVRLG